MPLIIRETTKQLYTPEYGPHFARLECDNLPTVVVCKNVQFVVIKQGSDFVAIEHDQIDDLITALTALRG
jgi:hypothetical protein